MKKILLASTVLAMTSTLASAEISFSGYGRFGLNYNDGDTAKTTVVHRMRVNINGSVETDAGVKFGGRIRIQSSSGQTFSEFSYSQSYVYAEMSGFRVEVGNANTAYDSAALMYNSEIGFSDRSYGDPNGDYFGFESIGFNYNDGASDDRQGALLTYSVGDLNLRLSSIDPDQTDSVGSDTETGVSADYKFGAVTLSAAYVDHAHGDDATAAFVGAEFAFNDAGNVGILYFDYDDTGTTFDSTRVTIYGNYTLGATTVAAYVANDDETTLATDTAYGLGVSYDLGGARAAFDIHSNYDEETIAGLGVRFDF